MARDRTPFPSLITLFKVKVHNRIHTTIIQHCIELVHYIGTKIHIHIGYGNIKVKPRKLTRVGYDR
jgi:hypothetical protein